MIRGCVREPDVLQAAQTAQWSDELRSHVARCHACADLYLIVTALVGERRQPTGGHIADPRLIWRRAQLRSRHLAAGRATGPIAVVEILAVACAAAAGALLLNRLWPAFDMANAGPMSAPALGTLIVASGLGILLRSTGTKATR
jgi:hypothetical protein